MEYIKFSTASARLTTGHKVMTDPTNGIYNLEFTSGFLKHPRAAENLL